MSKPKLPKKTNGVKETAATNNSLSLTNETLATTENVAAPIVETQTSEAPKPPARKIARKPEIVKTEPRGNVVPINLEDEIRRLAYLLSERRGFEPGHDAEDWLAAEREVRQRYHQQSA